MTGQTPLPPPLLGAQLHVQTRQGLPGREFFHACKQAPVQLRFGRPHGADML